MRLRRTQDLRLLVAGILPPARNVSDILNDAYDPVAPWRDLAIAAIDPVFSLRQPDVSIWSFFVKSGFIEVFRSLGMNNTFRLAVVEASELGLLFNIGPAVVHSAEIVVGDGTFEGRIDLRIWSMQVMEP